MVWQGKSMNKQRNQISATLGIIIFLISWVQSDEKIAEAKKSQTEKQTSPSPSISISDDYPSKFQAAGLSRVERTEEFDRWRWQFTESQIIDVCLNRTSDKITSASIEQSFDQSVSGRFQTIGETILAVDKAMAARLLSNTIENRMQTFFGTMLPTTVFDILFGGGSRGFAKYVLNNTIDQKAAAIAKTLIEKGMTQNAYAIFDDYILLENGGNQSRLDISVVLTEVSTIIKLAPK
jgi:hypothetical protein